MRAFVRLSLPDGSTCVLCPGDLIGRLESAALHIDDARISEAHALVSLRGRELKLLALRGMFAIDGKPVSEVVLQPGLCVEPARGLTLTVVEVVLPDQVLALQGDGLTRQVLTGTCSLYVLPRPKLVPRYMGDAPAHLWNTGQGWRFRLSDGPVQPLAAGVEFEVEQRVFKAVAVALDKAALDNTRLEGGIQQPLHIIASYDTVHIHRADAPTLALDGISARIISELVAFAGPLSWEVLAGEIWPNEDDRAHLRRKWDVNVARLRRKLCDASIRADLVRSGGTGQVELFLLAGDRIDDRT